MANEIITINESEYNAILRQVVAVIEDSKATIAIVDLVRVTSRHSFPDSSLGRFVRLVKDVAEQHTLHVVVLYIAMPFLFFCEKCDFVTLFFTS